MKIDRVSLEELKRICSESFQRKLADSELQDAGQRIIRFLAYSEDIPSAPLIEVDRVR